MKAIIFDVDNTLIDWKKEFIFALSNVLKNMNYNFDNDKIEEIDMAIESYDESKKDKLSKSGLIEFINSKCNLDLPLSFVDNLINEQGKCFYKDELLEETIKYLSTKYDLYVISNWFTKTQELRLQNMKIAKYFKKIIGSDENYSKPDPKSLDVILNMYDSKDCLFVGDNLEYDVLMPLSVGMSAIWKTDNENSNYQTIKEIYELRNIL